MQKADIQRKVLVFTSDTVPYFHGSGKNAFLFGSALNDIGVPSQIISLNKWFHFPYKNEYNGSVVFRLPLSQRNIFFKAITAPLCIIFYFIHIARSREIVLFGRIMGYEFILLFAKLLGRQVIFQSTLLYEDDLASIVQNNWLVRILGLSKLISGYFAINPLFEKLSAPHLKIGTPVLTSLQGVDTKLFTPTNTQLRIDLRTQYGFRQDELIFVTVGIVCERKGYRKLFEQLAKLDLPFLLIVAGDYDPAPDNCFSVFKKEMRSLVAYGKEMLGNKIQFVGTTNSVHELIQLSDYFLFNSDHEGTPNAILEAMSCKVPIICKHLEGIDDILNAETATIYYKDSDICSAIRKALHTDTFIQTEKARHYIEQDYTIEHVAKRFRNTFLSVK